MFFFLPSCFYCSFLERIVRKNKKERERKNAPSPGKWRWLYLFNRLRSALRYWACVSSFYGGSRRGSDKRRIMVDLERRREKVAGQLFAKKREKRAAAALLRRERKRIAIIKRSLYHNSDRSIVSRSALSIFHCFSSPLSPRLKPLQFLCLSSFLLVTSPSALLTRFIRVSAPEIIPRPFYPPSSSSPISLSFRSRSR